MKSVAQGQQGRWTTWECVASRAISWAEFWKLPQDPLSFLIRATYGSLPSPQNLHQWLGTEQPCSMSCQLRHRVGSDDGTTECSGSWQRSCHEANNQSPPGSQQRIHFLRQEEPKGRNSKRPPSKSLTPGWTWLVSSSSHRKSTAPL